MIGALRRVTNKVRIEDNKLKPVFNSTSDNRATISFMIQLQMIQIKLVYFSLLRM